MQAVGYVARYVGNVVGATLGTVLYNKAQWGWGLSISHIFLLNALVAAACVAPFTYHLDDPNRVDGVRPLREQLGDIWHMVQRRTIYRPMAFVAVRACVFGRCRRRFVSCVCFRSVVSCRAWVGACCCWFFCWALWGLVVSCRAWVLVGFCLVCG